MKTGLDFYRSTWRQYILMSRARDQMRIEQFEDIRFLGWCSLVPYMEKGTTIQKFWKLPTDIENEEEKLDQAKKLMDEVTEKYRQFYKR